MFARILVALKFNPTGKFALETAARLATEQRAELLIFHALDYHLKAMDANDPKRVGIVSETMRTFENEMKPSLGPFTNYRFECAPTDPSLEICRLARDRRMDLIILGCHQNPEGTHLARVDLVAMTIFEKAPCPVMLVPYRGD